ncbi:MAG: dihydropteroate synthase [Candidatus Rokubacteria bacterium]|nr:dihydropteroate synthase [Candidatus Rokubacteria bacterium]
MTRRRASLASVPLGEDLPVAVMGILNVSPESFHPDSIHMSREALFGAAHRMVEAGAVLLDVGARSTAPYRSADPDEDEERRRLGAAVEWLAGKVSVPLSADTTRAGPARAALEAGAAVINDVSGLRDPRLAELVAEHRAGLILVATPVAARPDSTVGGLIQERRGSVGAGAARPDSTVGGLIQERRGFEAPDRCFPVHRVRELLREAMERARRAGIAEERVVLDPGIGFFRDEAVPWDEWDIRVLAGLAALHDLGRPLCVGVSRKSFVAALTGSTSPAERLAGSLAATTIAVLHGAALVRTHDVPETRDAIRVVERLRRATMAQTMRNEASGS